MAAPDGIKATGEAMLGSAPEESAACLEAALTILAGNAGLDLLHGVQALHRDVEVMAMKSLASLALDSRRFMDCFHLAQNLHGLLGDEAVREKHPSVLYLRAQAEVGLDRYDDAASTIETMVRLSTPREDGSPTAMDKLYVLDCCKALYAAGGGQEKRAAELFVALRTGHRGDAKLVMGFLNACLAHESPGTLLEILADEGIVSELRRPENSEHSRACFDACFDAAARRFKSGAKQDALDLWVASLAYLGPGEQDGLRARTARCASLAALALKSHSSAKQYVELAEKVQPGCASTAFLALKLCLLEGDEVAARRAVDRLARCDDAVPNMLLCASQEAEGAGSHATAAACLEKVRDVLTTERWEDGQSPPPQMKVLRNLVQLLMFNMAENLGAVYENLNRAKNYLVDGPGEPSGAGSEDGSASPDQNEVEWFAITSWNLALRSKQERQWGHVANFMDQALAFFNLLHEQGPGRQKLKLAGALQACAAVAECHGAGERTDEGVFKSCLRVAKAALAELQATGQGGIVAGDGLAAADEGRPLDLEDAAATITFLEFLLASFRGDEARQKALLLELEGVPVGNLPAETYLAMANVLLSSSGAPRAGLRAVYKCALRKLMQAQQPDLDAACYVWRQLYSLRLGDFDGLEVLREAIAVVGSATELPATDSVMWIVSTLWNRGVHLARFESYDLAGRFMDSALDLAPRCTAVSAQMLEGLSEYRRENVSKPAPQEGSAQPMTLG